MLSSAFLLEKLTEYKLRDALREAEDHRRIEASLTAAVEPRSGRSVSEGPAYPEPSRVRRLIRHLGQMMVAAGCRLERFGSPAHACELSPPASR